MRLLRRELKGKDDKLARVTEHSMMLAAHMDRLKGEVTLLSVHMKHEPFLNCTAIARWPT